jgi:hypothetical protein
MSLETAGKKRHRKEKKEEKPEKIHKAKKIEEEDKIETREPVAAPTLKEEDEGEDAPLNKEKP